MWVFRTASSKHTWWLRHHTHCRPTTTFYKKKFQSPLHDTFLRYNIWNGRHRIQLQYVKTNCKFGNNEIYFFHQPSTPYYLMSKIRITKNHKTVLKYCQNEFVVYIDFILLTLSNSLWFDLDFFKIIDKQLHKRFAIYRNISIERVFKRTCIL